MTLSITLIGGPTALIEIDGSETPAARVATVIAPLAG